MRASRVHGTASPASGRDFIRTMIGEDVAREKYGGRVATRFPPEPNGYLHIGHAKSICLNFGVAEEFHGTCNLRFDDTNPATEDVAYTEAIQEHVRWLGYDWDDRLFHASDYFEQLYQFAVKLLKRGKAYVDSSSEDVIRALRGTVTEPGTDSRYRDRRVEENIELFERMKGGEFHDGSHVLRAKIDMAHPNMLMRDPILYRIRHAHHYRTGDAWCIYPLYDFAHCLSDAIEGITHSLCTLEFKDNRELYDWVLREVEIEDPPEQTEFARLVLDYTVLSKRKLIRLVEGGHVSGWDDPRMPTIAGLRRRGVTPAAIRSFCHMIGVARVNSRVDMGKLEHAIRDDLNLTVPRVMCVLRPLKLIIDNYAEGETEYLDAPLYPHDVPLEGSRRVPFARELFVEREDFALDPPKGFHRLSPGAEVRLRYAYFVKCTHVVTDDRGEIVEVHCTYDPETRGGGARDGRKVKGTLHWVAADESLPVEVRLYDRLFTVADPDSVEEGKDFLDVLNPESLTVLEEARIEPAVADDSPGTRYQFERQGYFISDIEDSGPGHLVCNRTVTLRDTWNRIRARGAGEDGIGDGQPRRRKERSPGTGKRGKTVSAIRNDVQPRRLMEEFGLAADVATALVRSAQLEKLFREVVQSGCVAATAANWVANDVARVLRDAGVEHPGFDGALLAELIRMVEGGKVSRVIARRVLSKLAEAGSGRQRSIDEILAEFEPGSPLTGARLEELVNGVAARYPDKVRAYRDGRTGLGGFFVGEVMKESRGRADPSLVREMVEHKLKGADTLPGETD